jgi:4-alpha-glucanotransferase
MERSSGIICHITSLPGKYGIGTLGKEAFEFVDFLIQTKQKLWQILPLGPTGFGDSPYQCFSAYAGNPLLISLDELLNSDWLTETDFDELPHFDPKRIDFGKVIDFKIPLLRKAFERFNEKAQNIDNVKFRNFCKRNEFWLNDFSLFMALKAHFDGKPWVEWELGIRLREKDALNYYTNELIYEIDFQKFTQFLFFKQWLEVKAYANNNGVKIIGDIPIYIAADSADAWTNSDLFFFSHDRKPIEVAGVPPDYFSETGQLWGNPIFNWDKLRDTQFKWWIDRINANLILYNIIRIDHFRGFEAYWSVPFGEATAVNGHWVKAPGTELYQAIRQKLGNIDIIAEDLGVITREVEELRDSFGLPGMKVLQFGNYSSGTDEYVPHNFPINCVVYTGTHDNDTTVSWYNSLAENDKNAVKTYFETDGSHIHWTLLRAAWASVAYIAIAPLQDVLGLGGESRMNLPGAASGNWGWRFEEGDLCKVLEEGKLLKYTKLFGRF